MPVSRMNARLWQMTRLLRVERYTVRRGVVQNSCWPEKAIQQKCYVVEGRLRKAGMNQKRKCCNQCMRACCSVVAAPEAAAYVLSVRMAITCNGEVVRECAQMVVQETQRMDVP